MNKKIILSVFCIVTLLGLFAVTTPASAMTCNSATLNGDVTVGTPPTNARFYYSTNYNTLANWSTSNPTGTPTTLQYFNSDGPISQLVTGLSENTTYYFRLVVANYYGTQALNILNFTTPACPVTPTPTNPPTVNLQINGSHTPSAINSGGVASVTWAAQPSTSSYLSCTASGGTGIWPGGKPLSGLATFNLTQSTTFSITCRDSSTGLSDTDSVYIAVNPVAPQICQDSNATNYGGALPCTYQSQPTVSLTADQTNISYNSSTTIRWNSMNATSCTASSGTNGWAGARNLSGSFNTGALTGTTTYNINCSNSVGSDNRSVTIYVANQPPQTCQDTNATNYGGTLPCRYPVQTCQDTNATNYGGTLPCVYPTPAPSINIYADQTNLAYNGGTIVRWTSNNATSCLGSNGSNGWPGTRTTSGSFYTGQLTNTTTFSITCNNSSASVGRATTIYVDNQPLQTCQDPSATNYGGTLPCRYPVVQTCQDPSATNYGGTLPCRYPTQTCQDINAINYGGALPCQYSNIQPTVNLTADNMNLNFDESTTIRWYSNNATFCNATGGTNGWSGNRNTSGTFFTGILSSTRTFGITCSNSNGNSVSDSVTIYVDNNNNSDIQPSVNIYADDTNLDFDDNTRIRWDSTNADYCNATGGTNGWSGNRSTSGSFNTGSLTSDETYRIICTNSDSGRTNSDSVTVYVDDDNNDNDNGNRPSVTIFADRTNLSSNESTIIRWYPNDADSCSATDGTNGWSGKKSTSGGSFNTGSLNRTTTYSIRCTNSDGSDNDSVTVYVNNNNNNYSAPAASAPTAVTTSATQLSNTSAQLNSLIFTSDSNTMTWFEWGPTTNLGNSTNQRSIGSVASTTHSDTITGLTTGVTYYFRAGAENSYLRSYGNIMSFTMRNLGGVATTSTTVVRPTTIINRGGTQSLVMLTIDGGSENIAPLERRNYQVTWKNISSQTLGKVVLRVIFPKSITFESANKGSFSNDDNTLTLEIGTLSPGETDNMFLLASAGSNLNQGELIVTVANLVYTDQSNAQGGVLAYTTQRADLSGSVLGASAFGAGFLPSSFLGWLLLLILLLIILLLSRYLYNQFKGPQPPVVIQH